MNKKDVKNYKPVEKKTFPVEMSLEFWKDFVASAKSLGINREEFVLKAIQEKMMKHKDKGG
jgi:hypothetical protein